MSEHKGGGVVAITGGSSGIGLCTALLFAQRGYEVGLIARGEPALRAAAAQVSAQGGRVATAVADVADAGALDRAAGKIEAELGPIDVWVNNAGAGFFGTFTEMTDAEFRRVVDTVFYGVVNGTRAALSRMVPRKRGAIVQVGSLAAFRGAPLQAPYSASKFALRGFVEAVRSELIHDSAHVHIGMVHPPSVNTPFFSHAGARMQGEPRPLPPVYQPEIIAEAIWICATERRREMKVSGTTQQLAFLNWILPGVSDRIAAWVGTATQKTNSSEVARLRDPGLFEPAKRPSSVHGPFGREAFDTTWTNTASQHPVVMALGAAALALLLRPRRRPAPPRPRVVVRAPAPRLAGGPQRPRSFRAT